MNEFGFPRLYEDGTITVCKSVKGVKRTGKKKGGKELGKRKKSFELTSRKKREIRCTAIRQYIQSTRKILFCTLTFPGKVTQEYANECFSKYVENLTLNYKLKSYVAVKENHKSGNPHFHCLLEIPWTDFGRLNSAWCATFNDRFNYSANAFTTGRRKFAENIKQVAAYISKYISKAEIKEDQKAFEELISTRLFFCSRNVLSRSQIIDMNTFMYLVGKYPYKVVSSDYYSCYFLNNFSCLPETFLLPKPEKKPKKPKKPKELEPNLLF